MAGCVINKLQVGARKENGCVIARPHILFIVAHPISMRLSFYHWQSGVEYRPEKGR